MASINLAPQAQNFDPLLSLAASSVATRRGVLRSGGWLPVVAGIVAAAPALAPDSPDAVLIRLCQTALYLGDNENHRRVSHKEADAMIDRWFDVAREIERTPAKTMKGIQAKISVIRPLMQHGASRVLEGEGAEAWDDDASVFSPLVWSLLNDLVGRA